MKLKAIKTKKDYKEALARLESIFDASPGTAQGDEAEVLVILIDAYEQEHYPIEAPDPVEAILFRMEQQGLRQSDIAPYMGGKTRVSEVLNRKRPLTLEMIRSLHDHLNIPYESLIGKIEARSVKKRSYPQKLYEPHLRIAAESRAPYKRSKSKKKK
jgi:HTH-type transcriptional regulator/antitoxin HigA